MNRFIAFILLAFLSPVLLFLLVLLLTESRSPIFRQERVGKNGVIFKVYKFRTMRQDAPSLPTHVTGSRYVTTLGRILRRSRLDELPQLVNILLGTMNFIGPRPCLPMQTDLVCARKHLGILAVLPGVTGLAQSRGVDMSNINNIIRLDLFYIRKRSLRLDLKIICLTLFCLSR